VADQGVHEFRFLSQIASRLRAETLEYEAPNNMHLPYILTSPSEFQLAVGLQTKRNEMHLRFLPDSLRGKITLRRDSGY
jgi:hypothetical protein